MTSDNLSAGDVVVCIDDTNQPLGVQVVEGRLYRAEAILPPLWGEHGILLFGVRSPGFRGAFRATRFRKIDAAEPCFTTAMRELRPLETTVA